MAGLIVTQRFCGPPTSANGGYFAGLVAAHANDSVVVRLMSPPRLNVELEVHHGAEGTLEVRDGETVVAQARPQTLDLVAPEAPAYLEAVAASAHYAGFKFHPYPSCFVCGPQRERGDGLRIFPGALGPSGTVASPWVPDASLDRGDGKVRPEFMWAALDCPGWLACASDARPALLGEFIAHIDRFVHIDESCTVVGWEISANGRKHEAGTALFDEDGELCARARAVWIEPRVLGAS